MKKPGTVTAKVTNTGKVKATEVVQLYVRDLVGSVTLPVRQLKGFERIELNPGETREVKFAVGPDAVSFHRIDMSYGYEPGDFKVWVGGDSAAALEGSVEIVEK